MRTFTYFLGLLVLVLVSCQNPAQETSMDQSANDAENKQKEQSSRIVSLNGALTEIVFSLGEGDKVVATDVTSTFPEKAAGLPKVGHNRNISVEGVLAQEPNVILGFKGEVDDQLANQFKNAEARVVLFDREYSIEGVKSLIDAVNDSLGIDANTASVKSSIDKVLEGVQTLTKNKKVLFIYARGAGTLMVAGKNTPVNVVIKLAGAENTANQMDGFKPLTPEALAAANPEVLLMFNSGFKSLSGWEGLNKIPGMDQTIAGQKQQVITMDGQFLAGFSDRVGQAAAKLNSEIRALEGADVQ